MLIMTRWTSMTWSFASFLLVHYDWSTPATSFVMFTVYQNKTSNSAVSIDYFIVDACSWRERAVYTCWLCVIKHTFYNVGESPHTYIKYYYASKILTENRITFCQITSFISSKKNECLHLFISLNKTDLITLNKDFLTCLH